VYDRPVTGPAIVPLPPALGERIDVMPTVASLRDLILASEEQIDRDRRLPEELVEAMFQAGLTRTMQPREIGGLELHPLDFMDLIFELSRLNCCVGWIAIFQNGLTPILPSPILAELQEAAGGRLRFAGSHARHGRAVRCEGGYRFSGHWAFASGSPWASHLSAYAQVFDADGEPELDPDTGEPRLIDGFVPRADAHYIDNWQTFGLRGSGSGEFSLDDHFVPERHTSDGALPEEYQDRAIYTRFWGAVQTGAAYLGTAQGAIDRYLQHVRPLGKDVVMDGLRQIQLGEAEALVRAGRALAWSQVEHDMRDTRFETTDDAGFEANQASPVPGTAPVEFMVPIAEGLQVTVQTARLAKQVVNLVFEVAATDAVRLDVGIERCLRDLYTGAAHAGAAYRNLGMRGEYLMTQGLPGGPSITAPPSLTG
jgi:alkylation response protein AidB-like acyl-CoA dehydrogenase